MRRLMITLLLLGALLMVGGCGSGFGDSLYTGGYWYDGYGYDGYWYDDYWYSPSLAEENGFAPLMDRPTE